MVRKEAYPLMKKTQFGFEFEVVELLNSHGNLELSLSPYSLQEFSKY